MSLTSVCLWLSFIDNQLGAFLHCSFLMYSKTCVREPPSRLILNSGRCGKSCLSYKGTCHVILLAKLHDMYLYKTTTFPHQPLRSISKVAVLHRFYCSLNIQIEFVHYEPLADQGPIVQSFVSSTSSLVVKMLTVPLSNSQVFCKCRSYLHFVSRNISVYIIFNDQSFNDTLTNGIVSFKQLAQQSAFLLHK